MFFFEHPLILASRRVFILLVLLSVGMGLFPVGALGQQVLVDDPTSVEVSAAQLEAWHSREESYITPAIRVLPALEVAVGTVFL